MTEIDKQFIHNNKSLLFLFILWCFRIAFLKQGNAGGVAINKFVLLQMFAELGIFLILCLRRFQWSMIFQCSPIKCFSYLYLLGIFSCLWGIMPAMGSYFAFQNIIMLGLIVYLSNQIKDFFQLEKYYLYLNFFFIILYFLSNFGGGFHSVTFSTIGGFLFLYCLGEYNKENRIRDSLKLLKLGILVGILVLIISTSSGAMVSTACGFVALFIMGKNVKIKILALIFVLCVLFSYYFGVYEWVIELLFPGKTMVSIENAHGRKYLWDLILAKAEKRPLLGWGYASIERSLTEIYAIDAHNSFVGVIGNLGYIGCGILVLAMLHLVFFLYHNRNIMGLRGMFVAAICGLVNSNTSNFIATKEGLQVFAFQLIVVMSAAYFIIGQQKNIKQN